MIAYLKGAGVLVVDVDGRHRVIYRQLCKADSSQSVHRRQRRVDGPAAQQARDLVPRRQVQDRHPRAGAVKRGTGAEPSTRGWQP